MTEKEKAAVLSGIKSKILIAENIGLMATGRSWRELYMHVLAKPADQILLAGTKAEVNPETNHARPSR